MGENWKKAFRGALRSVLEKTGAADGARVQRIREIWVGALGEEVARETRIVSRRKGMLCVEVASSARLMELSSFQKPALLAAIQEEIPEVRDIRFRLGSIPDDSDSPKPLSS